MPDILPPAPVEAPFGTYNWADWYKKVRDAINAGQNIQWSSITGTPTTIAGYGITDAASETRLINTTAPLAGGGDLTADRTLTVATFSSGASGVVPASGGSSLNYLSADTTWSDPLDRGIPVTGSKAGNAALADLLAALELLGLITDSTS